MSGALHDVLIVFLKDPRPGQGKTRLAAELGPEGPRLASLVYRALAEAELRGTAPAPGGYERVAFFAPAEAAERVAAWLPGETLLPQSEGDLGARMAAAFAEVFGRGAGRACLIGTDVPWLDRRTVEDALASLDDHDLVVGSATDGGYYLLALDRPRPELFHGIAWSTPSVLMATLERASGLRLAVRLLDPQSDIDTARDLRLHWTSLAPLLGNELARELRAALGDLPRTR